MAAMVAAGATLLVCFPPGHDAFYPSCPLHDWLGLQCPGCGMTRALACLLAGRVGEALRWNALAVVLAPWVVGFAVAQSYAVLRWNCWRDVRVSRGWMTVAYAVVAAFGVVRNVGFGR